MTEPNTALGTVQAYLAAFRRQDMEAVLQRLSPEVVLHEAPSAPFPKCEFRGHQEYLEMCRFFINYWAEIKSSGPPQALADDLQVVLISTLCGRPNGSDQWLTMPIMERFVVKDGLITEIWPHYFDPAALPEVSV